MSTVRAESIDVSFKTTDGREDDSWISRAYNPQRKKYETEAAMADTGTLYISYVSLYDQVGNRFRRTINPGDPHYSAITVTESDLKEDSTDNHEIHQMNLQRML